MERYTITGTGAVWAFLLGTSHLDQSMFVYGWLIPIFFAVAGCIRVFVLHWRIKEIGDYIRIGEAYFQLPLLTGAGPPPVGWEHHRYPHGPRGGQFGFMAKSVVFFWMGLLALNILVAWLAFHATPPVAAQAPVWSWPF